MKLKALHLNYMKKRISLIIIFILAAAAGIAVAENFNSLDVILNLTKDFSNYHKKKQLHTRQQQQTPPPLPHQPHTTLRIGK